MKRSVSASIAAILLAATNAGSDPIQLLGADDFAWEATPEGVAFAALQGDRLTEPYQALVKLPAGTVSPPHIKTANMYGVMLQGEMVHYPSAADPDTARKMGPGSYYSIAAGTAHVSACVSATPCIAYLHQDGAFDFLPVQQ